MKIKEYLASKGKKYFDNIEEERICFKEKWVMPGMIR